MNKQSAEPKNKKFKKVNWHFTKKCNFGCKYCFVVPTEKKFTELNIKVLNRLSKFFNEINLVGGEPTIHPEFKEIVDLCYEKFEKVSIVTNGFSILDNSINVDFSKISSIGVSIDSFDDDINHEIGRFSIKTEKSINFDSYKMIANFIKDKDIKFKINLMVSSLTFDKKIDEYIDVLNPFRLKILGVMEMDDLEGSKKYKVTKEMFDKFVSINDFSNIHDVVYEPPGEMVDAYYIVNGEGELLRNSNNKYSNVASFLKDSDQKIESELQNIDLVKFNKRYINKK